MKIDFYAKTDVGRVRQENQDCYGFLEDEAFFYVCDGMGGGAAGDFASKAAVEVTNTAFKQLKDEDVSSVMITPSFSNSVLRPLAAVRLANRALYNMSRDYPKLAGMGTTFAGIMLDREKDIIHIYHVGDSRVYRVRNGEIELLTKDHSKINELLEQGKMREDEVKTAEIQSMITRALGTAPTVKIDYRVEQVLTGDYFVLCTDGLNGEIDDKTIRNIVFLNRSSTELIAKELVREANDHGGKDNTTVLAVKISEGNAATNQAGSLTYFGDENAKQTAIEDRLLKGVLRKAGIKVPKTAHERSFLGNPIVMGTFLTAILVGVSFFLLNRDEKIHDTKLIELSGKVAGISLEVRTPSHDQITGYKKSDDAVQKLQMIQDWLREKDKLTVPLENVQISIDGNGKEQFKGLTDSAPVDIQLPRGRFIVHLSYPGYRIINERMETRDYIDVSVEQADNYRKITALMITE